MRITTKKGDSGETSLLGERVSKADPRLEVIGKLDEAIVFLGMAISNTDNSSLEIKLEKLETFLHKFMGELAGAPEVSESFMSYLEKVVDNDIELKGFLRIRGNSTYLHLARTSVREAERIAVKHNFPKKYVKLLNRLSDALFLYAYELQKDEGLLEYF